MTTITTPSSLALSLAGQADEEQDGACSFHHHHHHASSAVCIESNWAGVCARFGAGPESIRET